MKKCCRHFEGSSPAQHLKEARLRGASVSTEGHAQEVSGAFSSAMDALKEGALLCALLSLLTPSFFLVAAFATVYTLWKTARSALVGWSRLEKLHTLIEQERWEIQHHRDQEKEELIEMYKLKGFSGKLLDQAIEVLMADDNRLLGIMLEEELGLKLRSHEHPLRQASGAFLGGLIGTGLLLVGLYFGYAIPSLFVLVVVSSYIAAKREGNQRIKAIVWNLSIAFSLLGLLYFGLKALHG